MRCRLRNSLPQLAQLIAAALLIFAFPPAASATSSALWSFTNVAAVSGIIHTHGFVGGLSNPNRSYSSGVAVGDYDRDGDTDIFAVRGTIGPDVLYRNNGNGTFTNVAAAAGVATTHFGCGPVFADTDGDSWLDLLIGSIEGDPPLLFRNLGDGTFQNVTAASGINYNRSTFSTSFADYDRDGDIDFFMTHRGAPQFEGRHLWRNNGDGTFSDADVAAGFAEFGDALFDYTFTANWADIDGDRWPDLLVTSDLGNSEIYRNDGDGTFTETTTPVISDEGGMGAAVGDYDNDGDLDWFVSSIMDSAAGYTGNRLYQNSGAGTFSCHTLAGGVPNGYWGWASSFQDFNNDGNLDLYHVNGWSTPFDLDPARMFVSNGNGTFTQRAEELGANFFGQGRGIAVFDFDNDGDLDIFIAQNSSTPILARNNGGNAQNHLAVRLVGAGMNTEAIGARVYATIGGQTQMREIRCGSNYVSQDPATAHFGLGAATSVQELRIEWPNGDVEILNGIPANNSIVVDQSGTTAIGVTGGGSGDSRAFISLDGAAPNPLVRDTSIRFRLAEPVPVTLRIFDASGRLVATVLDETRVSGARSVAWDGRDASSTPVSAGRYLYRIDASGRSARGKLTVVR
ncbi:MAG: FG-GAP-like repeat-containing protein [bacterium]